MPRPRFDRLSAEKRQRILEAAAKEFAANGYDGASLNKIVGEAGISKGAAYYYFDDKADLYATTVLFYSQELISPVDLSRFSVDNFWDELAAVYQHQFTSYAEKPWVLGVVRAGGSMSLDEIAEGPLAEVWQQAQLLLVQLLRRGRELQVIRTDLEEELLLSLIIAVDTVYDRWLFAHWSEYSQSDLVQASIRISDTLRRLLSPE